MTSLLTTAVEESCHNHLRGRRRSSVHPLSAVPRIFSSAQSGVYSNSAAADESAVSDDIELAPRSDPLPGDDTKTLALSRIPSISPLSHAHVSDYTPKMIIPRHQDSLGSTIEFSSPPARTFVSSPQNLCSEAGLYARKNSYDDLVSTLPTLGRCSGQTTGDEKCKFERMKWRLAAGCFAYFMCGWGDGVTGTVLPLFMADFHISFSTSSLLFAGSTCGFCIGTLFVERMMRGLARIRISQQHSAWYPYFSHSPWRTSAAGNDCDSVGYSALQSRHLALLVASLLHALFFGIMGARGGFPALFLAYTVAAFARAILTAALNVYFATVMPSSLGYAFGIWSIGGVASPLVCQAAVAAGVPWYQFYLVSLVLSAFNVGFLVLTFRPTPSEWLKEHHEEHRRMQRKRSTDSSKSALSSTGGESGNQVAQKAEGKNVVAPENTLRLALSLSYQWAFLIFILGYCGCETTTQGFMVSYLLNTRHANTKTVGYVTSGFWGGITIGRFAWGYFMSRLNFTQRKYLVHLCLTIGLIMELLIWFVNSNIANAFSTSVIGVVFGPVFPASLSLANALLPERVQMVSMALICSAGSVGAAIFPFIAGVISVSKGVQTLTYVTVPLAASLVAGWFLLPSRVPAVSK